MAEKLTPQQQMAVDNRGGKLLVSAAAGSGKTKVLVDRLLKYIKDPVDPANIDDFLIITYTKAAASELRAKIASKLSEHIAADPGNRHLQRQLQRLYLTKISTVHAFCSELLREYAYLLDISADFRVADENEVLQLRDRAMDQILETAYENIGNDPDLQAFVDTQGLGRSDALVAQIIWQVYESSMCHKDPEAWRTMCVENAAMEVADPLETPWGRFLADDLFAFLDDQIRSMTACVTAVEVIPGLEKPSENLRSTLVQLQELRNAKSWDEILARKKIDYGRLVFPKKADDPAVTEPVKAVRNACKELLEKKLKVFSDSAEQILADLGQSAAAARGLMTLVEEFSQCYSRMKRLRRVLDFSDLEHRTLDLLLGKSRSNPTAAAREIGKRFREIMVDEYQDSNGVQDAIFASLTEKSQSLFMVGDVKQSIYQFRLADPNIFLEKYHAYGDAAEATPGCGRKVMLSSNFRSGGGVVEGANFVFRNCMSEAVGGLDYGDAEALREGVPHISIGEPEVELWGIHTQEDTYVEEAAFVADRITQLLDGSHFVRQGDQLRTIKPEDIVILLRSPGSVGMDYVDALESRGIPCASGTGDDLLMAEEIMVLRSLLQVISNPRQDIPLLAVLASPVFGFTAEDLAKLRCSRRKCGVYEALQTFEDEKAQNFLAVLKQLRRAAAMGTLAELFERIFNLTRLDTVYCAMEDGPMRREKLQSFYQLAVDFANRGSDDLDRFLNHLEGLEERGVPTSSEEASGSVTIMSIHKSKGLEFPVVFLCGLSRRFNQESLRAQVLCHKDMGLGLSCVDQKKRVRYPTISKSAIAAKMARESLSEEMRVLYVAMTRPKDRLIMTYASDSLDKDVSGIAQRMDISGPLAMTRDVSCPGQWVLYAALKRTEAGELFALGAKPNQTQVSDMPWLIRVIDGFQGENDEIPAVETEVPREDDHLDGLREALAFRYAYEAATRTPSKQTATQQKGRVKDQEAAEQSEKPKETIRKWRTASFLSQEVRGTAYGTAVHSAMQYIRYEACVDLESTRKEIQRLVDSRFITPDQGKMIDCRKLVRFFQTELGRKLQSGNVLREFKFSILDEATSYGDGLEGERVLLQGVVDCALLEADGITVVDFKTDFLTPDTIDTVTDRYAPQVDTYAKALQRIFELPVKAKALYYFHIEDFMWL